MIYIITIYHSSLQGKILLLQNNHPFQLKTRGNVVNKIAHTFLLNIKMVGNFTSEDKAQPQVQVGQNSSWKGW